MELASKRCPRCERTLPRSDYYHTPSGRMSSYCTPCRREQWRELHAAGRTARARERADIRERRAVRDRERERERQEAAARWQELQQQWAERRALMVRYRAMGLTLREIGERMGVTTTRVFKVLNKERRREWDHSRGE